jgi:Na+/melibiose symporter-like transporter
MNLFDYTSVKIKMVAKCFFWVASALSVLSGMILFVIGILSDQTAIALIGFCMTPVCVLLYWVSALMMYGFGRIVDNTDEIRYQLEQLDKRKDTQH